AANVHDTTGGKLLLDQLAAAHPGVTKVWADGGYQNSISNHGARLGIDVEVVLRPRAKGFEPLPKRWVILRLADAAPPPGPGLQSPAAAIPDDDPLAMANKMSREPTGESTPTWPIETDIPLTPA
ncbi:IS5/IS1182 family transposase, partial [Streptomyces pseudogriseolus]